jgi:hypothetical protein
MIDAEGFARDRSINYVKAKQTGHEENLAKEIFLDERNR